MPLLVIPEKAGIYLLLFYTILSETKNKDRINS
jgi:hypothetical protein